MIRAKLKFLSYAPIVFLSAKTGERADKLFPLINQCWEARQRRISTPALNNWLKEEVDLQRGTTPGARPVRIYYMTQAKIGPPTFLISPTRKLRCISATSVSSKISCAPNLISSARPSASFSACANATAVLGR